MFLRCYFGLISDLFRTSIGLRANKYRRNRGDFRYKNHQRTTKDPLKVGVEWLLSARHLGDVSKDVGFLGQSHEWRVQGESHFLPGLHRASSPCRVVGQRHAIVWIFVVATNNPYYVFGFCGGALNPQAKSCAMSVPSSS